MPHNEWVHVAVTHDASATTVRLFKNGVLTPQLHASAHATYYATQLNDFTTGQLLLEIFLIFISIEEHVSIWKSI